MTEERLENEPTGSGGSRVPGYEEYAGLQPTVATPGKQGKATGSSGPLSGAPLDLDRLRREVEERTQYNWLRAAGTAQVRERMSVSGYSAEMDRAAADRTVEQLLDEVERLRQAIATAVGSPRLGADEAAEVLAEVIKAHVDAVVAAEAEVERSRVALAELEWLRLGGNGNLRAERDADRTRREAAEEVVRAADEAWGYLRLEEGQHDYPCGVDLCLACGAEVILRRALDAYREKYPEERP